MSDLFGLSEKNLKLASSTIASNQLASLVASISSLASSVNNYLNGAKSIFSELLHESVLLKTL